MSWFEKILKKKASTLPAESPQTAEAVAEPVSMPQTSTLANTLEMDIPPSDPLLEFILSSPGVIEVDKLNIDSPILQQLKQANVHLAVPLVSQGELIGLLNLGPRLSEADYSTDDRRLLNTLSTQAAPALRVAQMARQQQIEALERERMAHELRVARVIQQTLLPKEIPAIPGWSMAAHWQPARAVSGDFYDFISFPDGKMAIIVGDVTDKGVPAALVMATTRSILRTAAEYLVSPGRVLEEANNRLCPDMPPNMFVTCLYALLDPETGLIRYANAGHNLPSQRTQNGVEEICVRGMPLGLLPDMPYEEKEATLECGENLVLYSDGLVEAHNAQGEMFGFPRLHNLLTMPQCGDALISCLLDELSAFTGPDWEQEDDVTFVTLERLAIQEQPEEKILATFSLPSHPGNERQAMDKVGEIVQAELNLPQARLERLKTAVAEATMNAMEHGNRYQPDLSVDITVSVFPEILSVKIMDHGGGKEIKPTVDPNLDAKLEGMQSPRGWGLFLIKNMVDEMRVSSDDQKHTLELIMNLKGD
jgi:serine phosphatase RsbU (regulator of sigma subunit)/anti-sigma regulatory factor (Ser/Thr protein kinase)